MTPLALMVKLQKSTQKNNRPKVCLLAAGIGSRNEYANDIVKGFLPYRNKPLILYILRALPRDYEIIVAVGHNKHLYKQMLPILFPKRSFKFVNINPYHGKGSGPGYSLKCCKKFLNNSFFLIPSDAYISSLERLPVKRYDWIGIGSVTKKDLSNYCLAKTNNKNNVIKFLDKENNPKINLSNNVFTGIAYIHNYKEFFNGLEKGRLIKGEKQVSSGLENLVLGGLKTQYLKSWRDVGNSRLYEDFAFRESKQNLLKKDEITYILDNTIIKYYKDEAIIRKKISRAKLLYPLTPKINESKKNYFSYQKINGHLLSEEKSTVKFHKFIDQCQKTVFKRIKISKKSESIFYNECLNFYKKLTLTRINEYFKKWPAHADAHIINGEQYPDFNTIWKRIPWGELSKGVPTYFHGDFQPENIICSKKKFHLIDWRHEFTDNTPYGDLYYDLSKLNHALIINGQIIRDGKYLIRIKNKNVELKYSSKKNLLNFHKIFQLFLKNNMYSSEKVDALTGIIYLRIASLYETDYSNFLYFLGIQYLSKRFL